MSKLSLFNQISISHIIIAAYFIRHIVYTYMLSGPVLLFNYIFFINLQTLRVLAIIFSAQTLPLACVCERENRHKQWITENWPLEKCEENEKLFFSLSLDLQPKWQFYGNEAKIVMMFSFRYFCSAYTFNKWNHSDNNMTKSCGT